MERQDGYRSIGTHGKKISESFRDKGGTVQGFCEQKLVSGNDVMLLDEKK